MTAAAFKATYSDWKLIKTRSVVQIIFEVPLDASDAAYQVVGGMPDFGSERWFAIARLNPEAKERTDQETQKPASADPPARAHKSWRDMPAAAQAAIRCNEVAFQKYLQETHSLHWKLMNLGTDAERAAEIVRFLCGVKSRADIKPNTEALSQWETLDGSYQAWMRVAV